jgi:hypothetical protein
MNIFKTGSFNPSSISCKNVLKFSSIGKFYLLISADIASLLFGSRLTICSSILYIASNLVDQVWDKKQVIISRPNNSMRTAFFSFYSLDNGSEKGSTPWGYAPYLLLGPAPIYGSISDF